MTWRSCVGVLFLCRVHRIGHPCFNAVAQFHNHGSGNGDASPSPASVMVAVLIHLRRGERQRVRHEPGIRADTLGDIMPTWSPDG